MDLAARLKETIRRLPEPKARKGETASEVAWRRHRLELRQYILTADIADFLNWHMMRSTICLVQSESTKSELAYLQGLPEWGKRWKVALEESEVGNPVPNTYWPAASTTTFKYVFPMARLEALTGIRADQLDFIFEFGGGYGGACRSIHRLGFAGRYLLYDLPEFAALQCYYLEMNRFRVLRFGEFLGAKSGIACISEFAHLRSALSNLPANSLFLATWSLSETPLVFRKQLVSLVADFGLYLIGYQNNFRELDNKKYFAEWEKATQEEVDWHTENYRSRNWQDLNVWLMFGQKKTS